MDLRCKTRETRRLRCTSTETEQVHEGTSGEFPGLKSYKAYTHKIGSMGTYVEFYEFPDMGVAEKFLDFGYQDKDHLEVLGRLDDTDST